MKTRAPVVALLALSACTADLEVPPSALVSCSVASPVCPDAFVCDAGLELCLPTTTPSGDGARVTGTVSITPPVVAAQRRIRVEFSTDHALIGKPALTIVSGAFAGILTYETGAGAGPYVYSYETTGGEAEGLATIRGAFADAQGRISRDAPVGTVELDYTPPIVERIDIDESVVADNTAWVDTTSITLRPVLPIGGETPASAAVTGDVTAPADLGYAPTLPASLNPGDGPKVVQVELADAAGNVTALAVPLVLDTVAPSSRVVIDTPVPLDVFLNAAGLSVFFHSSAAFPADVDGYVFSTDAGATWEPTPTLGALVLTALPQDATTTLWVRERDVFGNLTAAAAQGVLVLHEDSQPPSAPIAFSSVVHGRLTSEVGVQLDAARDPGNGPVVYQIIGGPYAEYTDVSTEPRVVLPGAKSGATTVYVIRAVDRAGNASSGVTITVADLPFKQVLTSCSGGCFATHYHASSGLGAFAVIDPGTSVLACGTPTAGDSACRNHVGYLCKRNSLDDAECSSKIFATSRTSNQVVVAPNIGGSVYVFTDQTDQLNQVIRAMSVGADSALSTADDGALVTIGSGNCQSGIATGTYFGNSANSKRATFYNYGNDRRPGTSDTGEGVSVISAASVVIGANPCYFQTSARQVMWIDGRTVGAPRHAVFNVGADGKPGGGDDGGEWLVPHSSAPAAQLDTVFLGDNRVLVHQVATTWTVYDAGADQVFGNGDDSTSTIDLPEYLSAVRGDKAYTVAQDDVMVDLSTQTSASLNDTALGGGNLIDISVDGSMLFGALQYGQQIGAVPAIYSAHGEPLTFQVADRSGEGGPSGSLAGDLYVFVDDATRRTTLLNTRSGGSLKLLPDITKPVGSAATGLEDVDLDGGYFVWTDYTTSTVMLFSVGADGLPGTADDRGPAAVTGSGKFRWPRIDHGVLAWADLSADADGEWVGANLSSTLKALDLGADGWLGGGDDDAFTLTAAGSKVVTPDIANGVVVYLDFAGDGSGLCEGSRGGPATNNCTPAVARIDVAAGATPTQIAAGGLARAELRIDGNRVLWSEFSASWDIRLHTLGGATITAVATPYEDRIPMLVGSAIAYYIDPASSTLPPNGGAGVFVVDAGVDATFGTSDDVVLRRPANITPRACATCTWEARPRWFDGDVTASGGGLMPVATAFDSASGGSGLAIPDNGTLTNGATLVSEPWQHVEDLRVRVKLTHATPSQLELRLVSPSGERLVLSSAVPAVGTSVDTVFTLENAPNLFGLHGDPLAGAYTLEVADRVAGGTGTLTSWGIDHRR